LMYSKSAGKVVKENIKNSLKMVNKITFSDNRVF